MFKWQLIRLNFLLPCLFEIKTSDEILIKSFLLDTENSHSLRIILAINIVVISNSIFHIWFEQQNLASLCKTGFNQTEDGFLKTCTALWLHFTNKRISY